MPRTKKAAGRAVDQRNGRRAELAVGQALNVPLPRPREAYQPLALAVWDGYWSDAVAGTVTPADLMIVWAWIDAWDDSLTKRAAADLEPMVEGSMGQMIANPLYAVAQASMALAMQCARQLGIGGKHRADLGIALIAEHRGLEEVNAAYQDSEDDDDGDDDDPRTIPGDLA
jgi:hypothetical protein